MQLNSSNPVVLAVVDKTVEPPKGGRIRLYGSWWPALSNTGSVIPAETIVKVTDRVGIFLIVEPIDSDKYSSDCHK